MFTIETWRVSIADSCTFHLNLTCRNATNHCARASIPLQHGSRGLQRRYSPLKDIVCKLSAGSDKIHAKSKFLSTWWSTDFSKNYTVGRLMDLLFSPNLFFLKSFALLRKSGLYFLTIILTFSLKSTGKWWRKSATFFVTCVDENGNVTCTGMKLNYWTTLSRNKMLCKMGMCPII